MGAIVVNDGQALETELNTKAAATLADQSMWSFRPPGQGDRRKRFSKEGFHYTRDSEAIRNAAISVMRAHDFRAHIIYSHLTDPQLPRTSLMKAMYFTLVRTLLQRYAGEHLELSFENEPSMNTHYGPITKHAMNSLDRAGARKHRQPRAAVSARLVYKPNGGVATVDYCLAIANHGLQAALLDSEQPIERFRLESLAAIDAHIAHVADFDAARHRRRFDMLSAPSWARHIAGANSHSSVNDPFVTAIRSDPTGLFAYVQDRASLAAALGKTPEALSEAVRLADDKDSYRVFRVKIRGKTRQLASPRKNGALDGMLRRVADFLRPLNDTLHASCTAYVPGRGCRDAAAPHAGHLWVQKLDIKSFFRNTTTERVSVALRNHGANSDVAGTLAAITTFRNELTTGARTSPLISNLILTGFDAVMAEAAETHDLVYTRYADDLFFSGSAPFDMTTVVVRELAPLGYRVNAAKTVLRRRGQPLRVAGLTVFEGEGGPRLPKRIKRRLRLEVFLVSKALETDLQSLSQDEDDPEGDAERRLAQIRGLYRYCRSIEPEWCGRLVSQFPGAQQVLQGPRSASERSRATAGLILRIDQTWTPALTTDFQSIGQAPPVDSS